MVEQVYLSNPAGVHHPELRWKALETTPA